MTAKKKTCLIDIVLIVLLAVIFGVSMAWSNDIETRLGLLEYVEAEDTSVGTDDDGQGDEQFDFTNYPMMYVHFVDVGQGDCAIIELPDGKTILIDGGDNDAKVESAIQTFIDDTLPSDFKYFDYAILTHPDSDHCGSLDYVLGKYPARFVYRPNVEAIGSATKPYTDPGKADLSADAVTKNTLVYADAIKSMYYESSDMTSVVYITDANDDSQTISGGSGDDKYSLTFYTPLSTKYTGDGDWNNYSPIMVLEYRGFKFAMSGDAEKKNLGEFVNKVNSSKTDNVTDKYDAFTDTYCVNVIKAGHHGSDNATTPEYLDVMTTEIGAKAVYTVISCGENNKYGHPYQTTLDMYAAIGVPDENILRTDKVGNITFSVHIDESGAYNLYYGNKATKAPVLVLVYKKLGGIELKWAVVAWTLFAVLAVVAIVHMIYVCTRNESAKSGKSGGGKSGGNNRGKGKKRK